MKNIKLIQKNLLKFCAIGVLLSLPVISKAQIGFAIGPKVGFAVTSFAGSDAESVKARGNWVAGLFSNFQLAPSLAIQPELLITQRGATQTKSGIRNDISINYFEVPILAKFRVPIGDVLFPHILLGPSFDFNINSKFTSVDSQSGSSISVSAGDIKKTDVAGILGAGIDIQEKNVFFTIDGRYNIGFNTIGNSGNNVYLNLRNRGWTFAVGVGIRFGTK